MSLKRNELISSANKFFQQGRWDKAVEKYKQVLELEPKNVNVHNMLGDCYLGKGDNASAFESYQQASDILIEQGLVNKAIAIYKKVLRIYPENPELYEKLANCYIQSGLVGEANAIYLKMADLYAKEGKQQEALGAFRKIAELNPNNVLIRLKLAEMYAKQGLENEGIAEFLRIADAYQENNQEDKLLQLLMRGKKIFPKSPKFYQQLGEVFINRGDYKDAIVELKEALELQDSISTLQSLADCAVKVKDKALLDENVEKLGAAEPENSLLKRFQAFQAALGDDAPKAYINLSKFNEGLISEGNYEAAAVNLNDFSAILGECPETMKLQYQLYYAQDEKEEELVEVAKKLAFHYHNTGLLSEAEEVYSKVLEKYPFRKDVREGAPPKAASEPAAVSEEIPAEPVEAAEREAAPARSTEELLAEASELAQEGMFDEAISAYDQVIDNDSSCQDAYYQRALVHRRQENYQAAVTDFKKYLEFDEENIRVWVSLGEVYNELSNPQEAAAALEKAAELDDSLVSVFNHLEGIYNQLGDEEKLAWCRERLDRLSSFQEEPAAEVAELAGAEMVESSSVESLADEFMPELEEAPTAEIEPLSLADEEVAEASSADEVAEVAEVAPLEVVEEDAGEAVEDTAASVVVDAEEAGAPADEEMAEAPREAALTPPQSDTDISEIELAAAGGEAAVAEVVESEEIDLGTVQAEAEETGVEQRAEEEVEVAPEPAPEAEEEDLEEVVEYGEEAEITLEALEQAKIFFSHRIYTKAMAECNKVLEVDPDNIEAQQIILQIKEKGEGKDEEKAPLPAFDGSTRAISSQEESILDHLIDDEISTPIFSESELDTKALDELIADFKTGVIEDSEEEDYDNHYNLGLAFSEMGLYDEAIGEFQIAAKDEANYLRCCSALGECYMEKGIYSLATEELSNGLEMAKDVHDILNFKYQLAIAYEKDGDLDKAIEMYQGVAEEDVDYEEVATRLDLAKKAKEGQA